MQIAAVDDADPGDRLIAMHRDGGKALQHIHAVSDNPEKNVILNTEKEQQRVKVSAPAALLFPDRLNQEHENADSIPCPGRGSCGQ
jgi:hypothetical protein